MTGLLWNVSLVIVMVGVVVGCLILYACLVVSARCSRWEEEWDAAGDGRPAMGGGAGADRGAAGVAPCASGVGGGGPCGAE